MSFVRKFIACLISIALVLAQLSATARGTSIDVAGNGSVLSLGINGSKGSASRKWTSPSGIITRGSLDVIVGNATRLKGAVIASQSNDLQLSTRTLSTQDIALYDNDRQVSGSIGINTTINSPNGTKSSKPGFNINATYANKQIKGIARATISGGRIEVTSQTNKQTARQLASLNRNADKSLEITSVIDEGFELYGSDTSVKAIGKFLDKYLDTRNLTPKEKENVREALDALADGGEMVCGQRQGYNHWNPLNWLVTPAYAELEEPCTIYAKDKVIQLDIKTYDECLDAIEAYLRKLPFDQQRELAYLVGLSGPSPVAHVWVMNGLLSDAIERIDGQLKGPIGLAFKQGRKDAARIEAQLEVESAAIWRDANLSFGEKIRQLSAIGIDLPSMLAMAAIGVGGKNRVAGKGTKGGARFISRADGQTLDTTKISVPGPTNSPYGKMNYLLGKVPGNQDSIGKGGYFGGTLGFKSGVGLSTAMQGHLKNNFGSAVIKGNKIVITAPITGPNGVTANVKAAWQVKPDGRVGFVTAFPGPKL